MKGLLGTSGAASNPGSCAIASLGLGTIATAIGDRRHARMQRDLGAMLGQGLAAAFSSPCQIASLDGGVDCPLPGLSSLPIEAHVAADARQTSLGIALIATQLQHLPQGLDQSR